MISVDELISSSVDPGWEAPPRRTAAPAPVLADGPEIERAEALARVLPPSISGHGGDDALFRAAQDLATILGEDAQTIGDVLLSAFNPRCLPPWPESKIRREADRAASRQATPEARMMRRRKADPFHAPDEPEQGYLALDTTRSGVPRPTVSNTLAVLGHVFGDAIRYEECAGRVVVRGIDEQLQMPDGEWSDEHTSAAMVVCEGLQLRVPATVVDRAVGLLARKHAFNLLRDGLELMAETWDGKARVDRAFIDFWGAPDNAASCAASRVFFLSLAARGLVPGSKVDTCIILQGPQGIKKSSSLEALVGQEFFADSPLPIGEKDAQQAIRGKWLWEFGEHVAVTKRERNVVKQFLSQRVDRFRASYGRHMQDVPRTCVFVSSSNDAEILNDPTGARRFLPVKITSVRIQEIKALREQLLGEAAWRWINGPAIDGKTNELGGEPHWPAHAEDLALANVREDATQVDVWQDLIEAWLDKQGPKPFTFAELVDEHVGAVYIPVERLDKGAQMRIGTILRALGCERQRGPKGARLWSRAGHSPART